MSKKIIIVGPPGAGKTTLRKIFFEGENSSTLLEYTIEPTHGQESVLLKLREEVGIFDLAGQENQRWFETEERTIFYNTTLILVVIDITTPLYNILNFINKIIDTRNSLTPDSMIYILLHKIDLINKKKIIETKNSLNKELINKNRIKVKFSSVKKQYFTHTLTTFIEILDICNQNENSLENFDILQLKESIRLIELIDKEIFTSKKDLPEKLNIKQAIFNRIIENLIQRNQIQISSIQNEEVLSLTEKGKQSLNKIVKSFSLNYILPLTDDTFISELPITAKIPPFLGYFVSNKDGLVLLKVELDKGILLRFLKNRNITEENIDLDKFDVDLIPMFISALEKFSQEINIKDLNGFSLLGTNLKMQIFGFEYYTMILFSNPNVNIKNIEYKIRNYFNNLFEFHDKELRKAIQTNTFNHISDLEEKGVRFLKELNKSYEHTIINLDFFDNKSTQNLYNELDDLQKDITLEFSIILEKVKKLKIDLMKAIMEENFEEVKNLAQYIQNLKSTLTFRNNQL